MNVDFETHRDFAFVGELFAKKGRQRRDGT